MKYEIAVDILENKLNQESKLGLDNLKIFLKMLNNPEKDLKFIHIAGTNGKGSTALMIGSILKSASFKVGVYTSPHLVKYNERFKINGLDVSDIEFLEIVEQLFCVSEKMKEHFGSSPTIFEFLTAFSFVYFKKHCVNIAVMEVGLGGRLDATNVIANPLLAIITEIGFDHMAELGDTIEKIAFEKAGIIKKNAPAILYYGNESVYNVINNVCYEKNSNLTYNEPKFEIIEQSLSETVFSVKTKLFEFENLKIRMLGLYQLNNAATALTAIWALNYFHKLNIDENAIRSGLSNAYWPGRMEVLNSVPLTVFDGSHNIDGALVLIESVKHYFKNKKITLLFAVLKDKEYEKIAQTLASVADKAVITQLNMKRALGADKLYEIMKMHLNDEQLYVVSDIGDAYEFAKKITDDDGVILISGSLYLIGSVKSFICN